MNDFVPRPDRAVTHASNALRSLEDLKQILLASVPDEHIALRLLELVAIELKTSKYHLDGDRAPLMPPQISLQAALNDLGVKFDGN